MIATMDNYKTGELKLIFVIVFVGKPSSVLFGVSLYKRNCNYHKNFTNYKSLEFHLCTYIFM